MSCCCAGFGGRILWSLKIHNIFEAKAIVDGSETK
jgi:hypothetical protein